MIDFSRLSVLEKVYAMVTSSFGIGFIPFAPGTFGSIVAIVIFAYIPDKITLIVVTTILLCIGIIFANQLEKKFGKDPQWIVIDEVVGLLIPLLFITFDSIHILTAFLFFRFFDIVKPLGIKKLQDLPGGFGVMLDDVLAGIFTVICVFLLIQII